MLAVPLTLLSILVAILLAMARLVHSQRNTIKDDEAHVREKTMETLLPRLLDILNLEPPPAGHEAEDLAYMLDRWLQDYQGYVMLQSEKVLGVALARLARCRGFRDSSVRCGRWLLWTLFAGILAEAGFCALLGTSLPEVQVLAWYCVVTTFAIVFIVAAFFLSLWLSGLQGLENEAEAIRNGRHGTA